MRQRVLSVFEIVPRVHSLLRGVHARRTRAPNPKRPIPRVLWACGLGCGDACAACRRGHGCKGAHV
eukprot:2510190-Prymnesium_polylepis.1